jgi:hypothetical protein
MTGSPQGLSGARACRLHTAARYSNLYALRPPWAGVDILTRLGSLIASRVAPVVCIQMLSLTRTSHTAAGIMPG